MENSPFSYNDIKDMPFPELFEWADVGSDRNKIKVREAESANKRAEEKSKRRTR
ncbi:MAG: hypothetical protein ACJAY9_000779 [Flavobacteriales bacterium]